MTFLQPDDHLIVMNLPDFVPNTHGACVSLTQDDLKRLADVGVRTVLNYSFWRVLKSEGWRYLDTMVRDARRAGLRTLLAAYCEAPDDLAPQCYCRHADGQIGMNYSQHPALSIWSPEARAEIKAHYGELLQRYGNDDVTIMHAGMDAGEVVLPRRQACLYDDAARTSHAAAAGGKPDPARPETLEWLKRSVVDYYLDIDALLVQQRGETWNALHPVLIKNNVANGNIAQEDVFAAEQAQWPDAARYLIQYTYWAHTKNGYKGIISRWVKKYGLQMIVEADHCTGLPKTAPQAIAKGFRGQVVAPVHPWVHTTQLEQEHVDAISDAVKLWERA